MCNLVNHGRKRSLFGSWALFQLFKATQYKIAV